MTEKEFHNLGNSLEKKFEWHLLICNDGVVSHAKNVYDAIGCLAEAMKNDAMTAMIILGALYSYSMDMPADSELEDCGECGNCGKEHMPTLKVAPSSDIN